jgi:hypothetical protein
VAATRSIASRARSRLRTLTFDISRLPGPRNWAMAGGSNRSRAPLVRLQLTPGLISSLPRTAGLPLFISFSTSYGELDSLVRRPTRRIGKLRGEDVSVAQAALLDAKHRKSIDNPGEEWLSPWATGQRAVCRLLGNCAASFLRKAGFTPTCRRHRSI